MSGAAFAFVCACGSLCISIAYAWWCDRERRNDDDTLSAQVIALEDALARMGSDYRKFVNEVRERAQTQPIPVATVRKPRRKR